MYTIKHKLSKQEQTELFVKLARSLSLLRSPQETAEFLKDLLSEAEVLMLARRLQIAEMLVDGQTYEQIKEVMKVGQSTIARVQTWLELYGEGYRTVIDRSRKYQPAVESDSGKLWAQHKRKYPMYYWPELLLEELVKSASKREKQRLLNVVEQLRDKTALSKELTKLLQ